MVTTRAVRATTKRSASAASPLLNGDEAFTPGSSSSSSREGTMGALQTPSTATSSSPSHPGEPRPMYGLASFADLDHALAGVADTPSCGSLPTGIAVPSASPPASVADLACDPLLAPNAARPGKAVSEVGPESPSRRVSSRSAGPAVMPRRTGICKFFNAQKGFGFVLDDAPEELGDVEVFVHYTAISSVKGGPNGFRSLLEGEPVEYSVAQGPKGWQAQEVTGPSGAPCIGSPPNGAGTSSSAKAKQLDGRRRDDSGGSSSRRSSLLTSEQVAAPASRPRPKSKPRSLGEKQSSGGLTHESDAGPGSHAHDRYRPTPEGYRQVLFHPYAQSPVPQQYFVGSPIAAAPELLYESYAYNAYESHRDARPSQLIAAPSFYAASHGGLVMPLPAFASSHSHSHFANYAPVYSPFSAAPSPSTYFYAAPHDPYSPYGAPGGLWFEGESQAYPISNNSPG